MLTVHVHLFHIVLVCGFTKIDVIRPGRMMATKLGDTVTLACFSPNKSLIRFDWYKQIFGQKPLQLASSLYRFQDSYYPKSFVNEFTETKRLSTKRGEDSYNLTISEAESGDTATYYCSTSTIYEVTFEEMTVLIVRGPESNRISVLQQPVTESVLPGDSVTLNCTINTGTCAGEHSVYWFRHDSGKSHPGIIYTHGDRSGQCKNSTETGSPTQSCVYNLPKRNLSLSDAGTYYCAVASCGEILFGNGTKLDIQDPFVNLLFIFFLTIAVIASVILNVLFCWRMKKLQLEQSAARTLYQQSPHENTRMSHEELHYDNDDDEGLTYAALKFTDKKSTKSRSRPREQRDLRTHKEEPVYSRVSRQDKM